MPAIIELTPENSWFCRDQACRARIWPKTREMLHRHFEIKRAKRQCEHLTSTGLCPVCIRKKNPINHGGNGTKGKGMKYRETLGRAYKTKHG